VDPQGSIVIAVDTNLLVYAHRASTPEHAAARHALERAAADPRGWGVPFPCVAEFWSVVTHPSATGRPSSSVEATGFLHALVVDGECAIWTPREGFPARLVREASRLGVRGPRVFDLQIALVAIEAGATEIWSHDAAFLVAHGLKVLDPLAP
jgi:predicted nucleic acid-binding protein